MESSEPLGPGGHWSEQNNPWHRGASEEWEGFVLSRNNRPPSVLNALNVLRPPGEGQGRRKWERGREGGNSYYTSFSELC